LAICVEPVLAWMSPLCSAAEPACAAPAPLLSFPAPVTAASSPDLNCSEPAPAWPRPLISLSRSFLLCFEICAERASDGPNFFSCSDVALICPGPLTGS